MKTYKGLIEFTESEYESMERVENEGKVRYFLKTKKHSPNLIDTIDDEEFKSFIICNWTMKKICKKLGISGHYLKEYIFKTYGTRSFKEVKDLI